MSQASMQKIFNSVLAGLLVLAIGGAVVASQQLAKVAGILNQIEKRMDRHEDRLLFLERHGRSVHEDE